MNVKIEDLAVVKAGTVNPYHQGAGVMGSERAKLLAAFVRGQPTPGWEFWYAPSCGGAKQVTRAEIELSQDEIDYLLTRQCPRPKF